MCGLGFVIVERFAAYDHEIYLRGQSNINGYVDILYPTCIDHQAPV